MLKFIILYVILNTAECSDIDAFLGNTLSVAAFPKSDKIGCDWYTTGKVDIQCACGEDTEASHANLLSYRYIPDNGTEIFSVVSIVNTAAEVVDALTKYNTCKCGQNTYPYGVYRPVNDKFYAQYIMFPIKNERIAAVLVARTEVTKTEIQNAIRSMDDLKTREYGLLCE